MSTTTEERNKKLVLNAFGALFNKRDYAAAEKYWSPDYVQHSAHIAPGRDGPLPVETSFNTETFEGTTASPREKDLLG